MITMSLTTQVINGKGKIELIKNITDNENTTSMRKKREKGVLLIREKSGGSLSLVRLFFFTSSLLVLLRVLRCCSGVSALFFCGKFFGEAILVVLTHLICER